MQRANLFPRPLQTLCRRNLHIQESQSNEMMAMQGISIREDENSRSRDYFLEVTIDRVNRLPCIITSFSIGGESPSNHAKSHTFGTDRLITAATFSSIAAGLNCGQESFPSLTQIISSLIDIFFTKEASSLLVRLSRNARGDLQVARSDFNFDDAAIRSGKRNADIQQMRDTETSISEEIEAERDGIVYIRSGFLARLLVCLTENQLYQA